MRHLANTVERSMLGGDADCHHQQSKADTGGCFDTPSQNAQHCAGSKSGNNEGGRREPAKSKRLEINLLSETFTLHETVRQLGENKEALDIFTLDSAVKRLLDANRRTGPGSKRTDAGHTAKEATAAAPAPVKRGAVRENDDEKAAVKTKMKPSVVAAAPVELQEHTGAANKTEDSAQKEIDVGLASANRDEERVTTKQLSRQFPPAFRRRTVTKRHVSRCA